MPDYTAIILAAGKGTRMKSELPKVMHKLAGKPLIDHVLDSIEKLGVSEVLTIVGHGREIVTEHIKGRSEIVIQHEQLGTGHALLQAAPFLKKNKGVLVLSGDQPLLTSDTLDSLVKMHEESNSSATVLTAQMDNPYGYGRIIRNEGTFKAIVEEKDSDESQKRIKEINTGTYCFVGFSLQEALTRITPKNSQGEYYLTDVFDSLLSQGDSIETFCTLDSTQALGINNRVQLAEAEDILFDRIRKYWMMEGVTIINPSSVFIDADAVLEQDVIIHPYSIIKGKTKIEEGAIIGPSTILENCYCQKRCKIENSVAREATIGQDCLIGPFAYLRPQTRLDKGVKVGDFVEIKNSSVGEGSKIPHLSYIGDSDIGKNVNIGAGTITCNYDGYKKHKTVIDDDVFVGSNTNLVAPVRIGKSSVIGAGSTITKDVPSKALALERAAQKTIENYQKDKDK
ncbi:MAG: bifunctional N-acetylglucosamine-1-phosphate uridyltransferase/glucosamine-1-phosphate acetyltransferase [Gracilibacter sp. BRH_c7a]|nr:MAG: bifunctional N-acetylglucosamine-1-phosphate uridyltransferase/glucosamine-1-phosphate acetyltransferase [Gracilibacter sp. BRH_c7a]